MPPGWMVPVRGAATTPVRKDTSKQTKHYESPHYSDGFTLDMKKQEDLGLMPPAWSVTSAMKDERPNGKPQFDARFLNTPMGRARAGRSIVWDPRGTVNAGGTQRLENIDITLAMAKKYAEMTNKAAESAYFAEYYDGVNTLGDDGANAQMDLQLAQMSKLQKKQMDKDGDGKLSLEEMEAQGSHAAQTLPLSIAVSFLDSWLLFLTRRCLCSALHFRRRFCVRHAQQVGQRRYDQRSAWRRECRRNVRAP